MLNKIKHKYLYIYSLILTITCNVLFSSIPVMAADTYVASATTYLINMTNIYFPQYHVHTGSMSGGGCHGNHVSGSRKVPGTSGTVSKEWMDPGWSVGDPGWLDHYNHHTACAECGALCDSVGHCTMVTEYYDEWQINCGRNEGTLIANSNVSLVDGKIHCVLNNQGNAVRSVSWTAQKYDMAGNLLGTNNYSGENVDIPIDAPKWKLTINYVENSGGGSRSITSIPPFIAAISVTYNGTDNTGGSTASNLIYFPDYEANNGALNVNGFTRDGYDFVTWNSQYSSNLTQLGTSINPGIITKAQIDSIAGGYNSFTMYAVWKAHNYSIEFYPNNPNFVTDDLTCDGEVIDVSTYKYTDTGYKYHDTNDTSAKRTFPACKYVKVGYRFLGWGFTPQTHTWNANTGVVLSTANVDYPNNYNGDNIRIPNGASTRSPNNNKVIKLYAQWEPIEFTLRMHSNDSYNSVDEPVGDVSGHNIDIHCTYDNYVTISDALTQFNAWYNDPIVTGLCSKEDYLFVNRTYLSSEQDLRFGDGAFVELSLNASEDGYTSSQKEVTAESKTPNETVGDMMNLDHIFYADTRMTDVDGVILDIYCIRDIYHIFYNEDTNKPTKVIFVSPDGTQTKVKGIFMNDMNQSRSREYLIFGH